MLLLALLLPALLVADGDPAGATRRPRHAVVRDHVEAIINAQRANRGVPRLRVSRVVQVGARRHARRMRAAGALFHDSRLSRKLPQAVRAWGENVGWASGPGAPRTVQRMFMASSPHRANILSPRWSHMGIGVARHGSVMYVTHRFIRR